MTNRHPNRTPDHRSDESAYRRGYDHAVNTILDRCDMPVTLRRKLERYANKVHDWRNSQDGFTLPPDID